MLTLPAADEIAANIVARWQELERIPLGYVGPTPTRRGAAADRDRDVLDEIPPAEYVEALTGIEVPHHGMIHCPLPGHDDRTPSFKAYDEPERGWYCFGCNRGGTIYDLDAELWDVGTRGAEFIELRRRLARALLRADA